ncbi:hypothetical protein [Reyranella soli]|nr:hypothetical protein [Reyranella soli]
MVTQDTAAGADIADGAVAAGATKAGAAAGSAKGTRVGTGSGSGLRPPPPSSTEPRGIPNRPTVCCDVMGIGADADAEGFVMVLAAVVGQFPAAIVVMPPPSNVVPPVVSAPDEPAVGQVIAMLPGIAIEDTSGSGPMPGEASSVAPMGIPVGPTGVPGPRPKGDVTPSGDARVGLWPAICAIADPQQKTTDKAIGRTM